MSINWRILIPGALVAGGVVAALSLGYRVEQGVHSDALTGEAAADFTLVDLDGRSWSLSDLRGTPVVLNFWSTWCLPCRQEHPALLSAAASYPEVQFLGIIYDDDPDKVEHHLDRFGRGYPHLLDEAGRVAIDYGVTGVPETFFIDPAGNITFKASFALTSRHLHEQIARIQHP